jgi:hypothetical protein
MKTYWERPHKGHGILSSKGATLTVHFTDGKTEILGCQLRWFLDFLVDFCESNEVEIWALFPLPPKKSDIYLILDIYGSAWSVNYTCLDVMPRRE